MPTKIILIAIAVLGAIGIACGGAEQPAPTATAEPTTTSTPTVAPTARANRAQIRETCPAGYERAGLPYFRYASEHVQTVVNRECGARTVTETPAPDYEVSGEGATKGVQGGVIPAGDYSCKLSYDATWPSAVEIDSVARTEGDVCWGDDGTCAVYGNLRPGGAPIAFSLTVPVDARPYVGVLEGIGDWSITCTAR